MDTFRKAIFTARTRTRTSTTQAARAPGQEQFPAYKVNCGDARHTVNLVRMYIKRHCEFPPFRVNCRDAISFTRKDIGGELKNRAGIRPRKVQDHARFCNSPPISN